MEEKVYFSLGSNLGDKRQNLINALTLLHQSGLKISKISKLYSSLPWGFDSINSFYNLCFEASSSLNPCDLLNFIKGAEKELGRIKLSNSYEDRIVDIDILFYGSKIIQNSSLTIPHQHLHNRLFVLLPLNDIASSAVHPILGITVKNMLENIIDKDSVVPLDFSKQDEFSKQCSSIF